MRRFVCIFLLLALCTTINSASAQVPPRPDSDITIVLLGSSVAAGWVTSYVARYDMQNGYAARLGRALDSTRFRLVNLSVPGDNTAGVLARFDADVLPVKPDFVIIGLSLANEGLETLDPDSVCAAFESGLQKIVARCRQNNIRPIIASCYSSDTYTESQYDHLKRMNLKLYSLGLPCINLLGAIDDGHGRLIHPHVYDEGHPDNIGHEEMFRGIVPTMFEAILAGKPAVTEMPGEQYLRVKAAEGTIPLSWIPSDVVHSFTVAFWFRIDGDGVIGGVTSALGAATVAVDKTGTLLYRAGGGDSLSIPLSSHEWHHVALVHQYLLGETRLFVDGRAAGTLAERIEPLHFSVGGADRPGIIRPESADYRGLVMYRTALNPDEIRSLYDGYVIPASLEILAPLQDKLIPGRPVDNLAQSMAQVMAYPSETAGHIDDLKKRIASAQAEREALFVVEEKKTVDVPGDILQSYVGTYEIAPGANIEILREGDRLMAINPDGDRSTLYAESTNAFFVRHPLVDITIVFVADERGAITHLILQIGGNQMTVNRLP